MSQRRKKPSNVCFTFLTTNDNNKAKYENDVTNKDMQLAFQVCKDAGLSAQWLPVTDYKKYVAGKNNVFVVDKFRGEVFDTLLKHRCRILGPKCVRICIAEGVPIPEAKSPVYTAAMCSLVITASHLAEDEQVEFKKLIGYMDGHYVTKFVKSVTHLVTNVAATAAYQKACEQGVPVMVEGWITAVWEASLDRDVKATDSEFDIYKCPVFYNLRITCSKLTKEEKEKIKDLITKHGGTFMTNQRQQETSVVVIKEPYGEKYRFARAWGLPCVLPSWIYESVTKGYAVDIGNHLVTPIQIPGLKSPKIIKEESPGISKDGEETSTAMNSLDPADKTDISETNVCSASTFQQIKPKPSPESLEVDYDSATTTDVADSIGNQNFIGELTSKPKIFEELNQPTEERVSLLVSSCGGITVNCRYNGIVDYAIVPLEGIPKETQITVKALEVVTELWVEDSLKAAKILPIHYYHQPMIVGKENAKPLIGCRISFSSYVGSERVFVNKLAERLGATCQKALVSHSNESEAEVMSTHLVCSLPNGSKYKAAVKYDVHVVTEEWLVACAKFDIKADEQLYFPDVYENSQMTRLNLTSSQFLSPALIRPSPVESVIEASDPDCDSSLPKTDSREPQTQHHHVPQIAVTSPIESLSNELLVNRKTSLASTLSPRSPFHVSTPDSPYGQIFRTPTDSTKKRWKKWINSFPNFNNVRGFPSSRLQERKASTPYSKIRKQIFERFLEAKFEDVVDVDLQSEDNDVFL